MSDVDTVQDKIDKSTEVALAEVQEKLFSVSTKYCLISCPCLSGKL